MIDAYDFGRIIVDGKAFTPDLLSMILCLYSRLFLSDD